MEKISYIGKKEERLDKKKIEIKYNKGEGEKGMNGEIESM